MSKFMLLINSSNYNAIHIRSFLKAIHRSKDLSYWFRPVHFNKTIGQIYEFSAPTTITLVIDYPFDCEHRKVIKVSKRTSVVDVVIEFAKFYSELYKTPSKSEVFGHCLDDLCFEGIHFGNNHVVRVDVGS